MIGARPSTPTAIWNYPWLWAIYLQKTGDLAFVKANFATEGPGGRSEPSIEDTAHLIAADRTGPGGIMEKTSDIDADGYWTIDDYEALMGLAAYHWLARRSATRPRRGGRERSTTACSAAKPTLTATIAGQPPVYLPCSMAEPNTANRCANPEDANWAAPFLFGRWAWDGYLFGAPVSGPGCRDRRHLRLRLRPAGGHAAGGHLRGLPADYCSTAYNAGYGEWGLASRITATRASSATSS